MPDSPSKPPRPMDDLRPSELFRILKSYVEHENGLINQRLKSGLAVHAFLFTFYGVVLNKAAGVAPPLRQPHVVDGIEQLLSWAERRPNLVIAIVGMMAAVMTFLSVYAAARAITKLRDFWEAKVEASDRSSYPRPRLRVTSRRKCSASPQPWRCPPSFSCSGWLFCYTVLPLRQAPGRLAHTAQLKSKRTQLRPRAIRSGAARPSPQSNPRKLRAARVGGVSHNRR